jgi:hypothetical protein
MYINNLRNIWATEIINLSLGCLLSHRDFAAYFLKEIDGVRKERPDG